MSGLHQTPRPDDLHDPIEAPVSRPSRAWIFQDRPEWFDLRGALQELDEIDWTVTRYKDQVKPGDTVYLWEAGRAGGVVAVAEVLTEVAPRPSRVTAFVRNEKRLQEAASLPRVNLGIRAILDPALSRDEVQTDPRLGALSILKFPQATNFVVTPEEAAALDDLIATRGTTLAHRPQEGQRVRLRRDIERYPFAIVSTGVTGTVVKSEPGFLSVRLDDVIDALEPWDNELQWTDMAYREDLEQIGPRSLPPVGSLIRVAAPGRTKRRLHRVESADPEHVMLQEMWRENGRWVESGAGQLEHRSLGPYDVVMERAPRDGDPAPDQL